MKQLVKFVYLIVAVVLIAIGISSTVNWSLNNNKHSSLTMRNIKALSSYEYTAGESNYGDWVINSSTFIRDWKQPFTLQCFSEYTIRKTFECDPYQYDCSYDICGTEELGIREVPVSCVSVGL
jgi:hypothetical protein